MFKTIVYQRRKVNILEDALSRSKIAELNVVNSVAVKSDQLEEVFLMMTRSSIVATKEIKIWRTVQEENPIVQDII